MSNGRIWSDEDTVSTRNLAALGRSDAEIARILGFSRETIVRRRKLLGIRSLDTTEARRVARLRGRASNLPPRRDDG
jgi:hypothetical protein